MTGIVEQQPHQARGARRPARGPATALFWRLFLLNALVFVTAAVLLRTSLRPLDGLTELMARVDLLRPGERLGYTATATSRTCCAPSTTCTTGWRRSGG